MDSPWASKSFSGRFGRSEVQAKGTASLQPWREGLLSYITESSRFETWWEKVSCCENKMSPAISINKKCHIHQQFLASRCERGLPKLWSSWWCHPPHCDCWGPRGMQEQLSATPEAEQGNRFGPDSWGECERNEFSEPRGLHLPIHRMLNSLIRYLIFDIQTACSLSCKLGYSLTSLLASLKQFSQSCWDAVSWAWSPKYSHQIK